MTSMTPHFQAHAQAHVSIQIAIVGGGLAGLTTALALARVGHRVTVFEQHAEDAPLPSGGVRIPPNQSKVLFSWGLEEELRKIAVVSRALRFYTYAQGEFLGKHTWDEQVIRECGGEWMFTSYVKLRALLLAAAREDGATLRFDTKVESIDEDEAKLTLVGGEVVSADVVVGADGSKSVMRSMIFEGEKRTQDTGLAVFNMTVPLEKLKANSALRELLEEGPVALWVGDGFHAHGFPLDPCGQYALHFYVPAAPGASIPDCWGTPAVAHSVLIASIGNAEPRLRMLASFASPASALFYRQHQQLEDEDDWLLPSGVGAVLGDAAHPAPPASIQASAMVFEDAAVFAKLFSHMRRADQAPGLMQAFAGLRAQRVSQVLQGDMGNIDYLTMPYDEGGIAKDRDQGMREATKVGKSALGGDGSDASASKQWEQILSTWGYDAEDEADNWWVEWGALGERAQEVPRALSFDFGAAIADINTQSAVETAA